MPLECGNRQLFDAVAPVPFTTSLGAWHDSWRGHRKRHDF